VLELEMTDARLDGGAAAQLAFDRFGDAPLLAGDVDLEPVVGRGVVAAIAAVGDDAREAGADLGRRSRGSPSPACGGDTEAFMLPSFLTV
jgi:hypothetical protein